MVKKNIQFSISKYFPLTDEYAWMNEYFNRYDLLKDNSKIAAIGGTNYIITNLDSI